MFNFLPLGEESRVRRDINGRGGLYFTREIAINSILLTAALSAFVSVWLIYFLLHLADVSISLSIIVVFVLFIVYLSLFNHALPVMHTTSMCPSWLYAEQLNPEQLKIYHFRKPPTIIKLAKSTLNPKTKFKHYTTLTITDKATETSATLGLLTPEEYDRFMQYWNAANPQDTETS